MALLKDTVVSGSLRATDSLLTTTVQTQILKIPTASNGTTYGPGTSGNIIYSNGTSAYWGATTGITSLGTVTTGTWSATVINPNKGGTGINSYAKGDILYASSAIANTATTALSKLALGTAGYFLKATADGPTWANTTDITTLGTITTGTWSATTINPNKGGTGVNSYAKGDILYAGAAIANTATTALSKLTIGSSGQVLQTTSNGIPGWITATNAKTASTIMKRDSNGGFDAVFSTIDSKFKIQYNGSTNSLEFVYIS